MLVLRPDVPEERTQAVLERTTRQVAEAGGQIVKAAPWGRRRLAYQVDRYREGSYHILQFDAPPEAIVDVERTLLITEDVLRHLVVRVERPVRAARTGKGDDGSDGDLADVPADEDEADGERIDESESEAAPAATD
jgi:small subunit ribosomal protein S6